MRVLMLPDGQDPDEFLKSKGAAAFRALKENALTLTECKIQALQKTCDMHSENGRTAFAQKAAALLKPLSPVERERYLKYIAKLSGFAAETILQQAEQGTSPRPARTADAPGRTAEKNGGHRRAGAYCSWPWQRTRKPRRACCPWCSREDIPDPMLARLYQKADELLQKGELSPGGLLASVQTAEEANRTAEMFVQAGDRAAGCDAGLSLYPPAGKFALAKQPPVKGHRGRHARRRANHTPKQRANRNLKKENNIRTGKDRNSS